MSTKKITKTTKVTKTTAVKAKALKANNGVIKAAPAAAKSIAKTKVPAKSLKVTAKIQTAEGLKRSLLKK
jgi:hypothetical protein